MHIYVLVDLGISWASSFRKLRKLRKLSYWIIEVHFIDVKSDKRYHLAVSARVGQVR